MKPASEIPRQERYYINDGATKWEHSDFAQIYNSDPCFDLTFDHAVFKNVGKEEADSFIEYFLFKVKVNNASNIDNDNGSKVNISPHHIK